MGAILFLGLEVATFFGVLLGLMEPAGNLARALLPGGSQEVHKTIEILLCLTAAMAATFAVDRLARRLLGFGILENLPYIP